MKKKIINGIMMVALVAATSTSFVSCKDTNEDVRIEQDAKIAKQANDITALQTRLNTLETQYGDLDGKVGDLKTKVDGLANGIEAVQNDIANLQGDITNVQDLIAGNDQAIQDLGNEVDKLQAWLMEAFAKLVTNVEISGTYNNMLGSINIPGIEPKMLIFNYGVATKDGAFPESLNTVDRIEWVANDILGADQYNPGFAGYLYANVNRYVDIPLMTKDQWAKSKAEHTFPAFDFALIQTNGVEADGVTIENAEAEGKATDDVLQWGWTRAENNIYKFGVYYDGKEAGKFAPAKIDLSRLKEDVKTVWRNRKSESKGKDLGHLMADLYYNFATKDTNMKKYALKISWADTTPDGQSFDHLSTSEAELVFASIKPLAFTSGGALAEQVDKGVQSTNRLIEKLEPAINKIVERVKKQLNLGQYEISKEAFARMYIRSLESPYKYAVAIPEGTTICTSPLIKTDDVIYVDVTDIVDAVEGAVDNMNKLLNNVEILLDKNYGKKVTDYIEKFTNKLDQTFANHADQILQPVLLAIDKDSNVGRVSGIESIPYVATGEITLKPTTYTAELLAPCYAKFVGCKDIKEDGFNEILRNGDLSKELKFTPEAGRLYEIVYEAVDFFGNKFYHKYYILGVQK
jgi:archaellum component FlaC